MLTYSQIQQLMKEARQAKKRGEEPKDVVGSLTVSEALRPLLDSKGVGSINQLGVLASDQTEQHVVLIAFKIPECASTFVHFCGEITAQLIESGSLEDDTWSAVPLPREVAPNSNTGPHP